MDYLNDWIDQWDTTVDDWVKRREVVKKLKELRRELEAAQQSVEQPDVAYAVCPKCGKRSFINGSCENDNCYSYG